MTNLSSQMLVAIKAIYDTNSTENINKRTINALTDKGLIIDGKLSEEGKIFAIANMNLSQQCQKLSLELIEINLNFQGTPELAALQYFQKEGYVGSILEGNFILTILKALMLDKLEEYNLFHDRKDARIRALSAQFVINKEYLNEIISSIRMVQREKFVSNIREITDEPLVQEFLPGISADIAIALFDATDLSIFEKIAIKLAEDPYEYSKGWPDLTIIKDKEVYLVEIKTTDKLHSSQIKMIPILREVLPFEISIYQIKNMKLAIEG